MEKMITEQIDLMVNNVSAIEENQKVTMVKDMCKVMAVCTVTAAGVYLTYNNTKYGAQKIKANYHHDVTKMWLETGKFVLETGIDIFIRLK